MDRAEEAFREAAVEPVRQAATWVLGLVRNTLFVAFVPLIVLLALLGFVHPSFVYAAVGAVVVLFFLLGLGYYLRSRLIKRVEEASLAEVADLTVDSALAGVMFWVYGIIVVVTLGGIALSVAGYVLEITPLLISGIVTAVAGLTSMVFSYLVVNFFRTFISRGVMRFIFGNETKEKAD